MKPSLFHFLRTRRPAFTLVELLVVMGIIAILAAVLLGVGNTAIAAAKRAKAANTATQIQTACLGYYTEYSVYPVGSVTTSSGAFIGDTTTYKANWGTLISVLSGNINPYNGTAFTTSGAAVTNSRGIAFLTLKSSDVDVNNAPLNPLPTGTGSSAEIYFNIVMDADYAGVLGVAPSTFTSLPKFSGGSSTVSGTTVTSGYTATGGTSTAGVAVWANCNGTTAYTNGAYYVHTY